MKICIITSTRADFGLLKNLIFELKEQKFNYKLITLGTHFSNYYGLTLNEIKESKIKIYKKIFHQIKTDNEIGISETIAKCTKALTINLKKLCPNLLIVLGDRYEILACAISAHICGIPVAHIHGGELTHGVIDDAFRHSITKMSQIHFVANRIYKKRVIQLGENPRNVFVVGGLGVDSIKKVKLISKSKIEKKLNIRFLKKNILINFHPETLSKGLARFHIKEILAAIGSLNDTCLIFTMPGADVENKTIINEIKKFVNQNKNSFFFKSLGQINYFSILKLVDGMVGNSSSGLLEMPTFKKATINLGNRQSGRLKGDSVIDAKIKKKNIINAINKIYQIKYQRKFKLSSNPYGKGGASKKIGNILKKIKYKNLLNKKFYDIKFYK